MVEKECSERCESAGAERIGGGPGRNVGIELCERLDGVDKRVDASELRDGVSGRREEFVVKMDVAAEIAKIQEVSERDRDEGLFV